jgi:hypothetical protein
MPDTKTFAVPSVENMSPWAGAAKCIRAELAHEFPGVKFKVRSKAYSGGSSVRVGWANGPRGADVEAITDKYEMGAFDGMIDLYVYSNMRDDLPQVKHVFCYRNIGGAE